MAQNTQAWFYGGQHAELHATNKVTNVAGSKILTVDAAKKAGIKVPATVGDSSVPVTHVVAVKRVAPSE